MPPDLILCECGVPYCTVSVLVGPRQARAKAGRLATRTQLQIRCEILHARPRPARGRVYEVSEKTDFFDFFNPCKNLADFYFSFFRFFDPHENLANFYADFSVI